MTEEIEFPVEEAFEKVLKNVSYPGFDTDIITMQIVTEARLEEGGKAVVKLRPVAAPPQVRDALEDAIAAAVRQIPGVEELELTLPEPAPATERKGAHAIEGVKAVVPVSSGKGGVGKSTVAVNLALALAADGLKVGLLDLDLYGPSVPIMLGLQGAEPQVEGNRMVPVEAHGIKSLSIGFLVKSDSALIWRGPLVMKAVRQLLHDVTWAPLDILVLDLPPGTGDVQITMAQEVPVDGAVVVTTPQDVALVDAIKGVDMFRTVGAPVLGIVENMSYFICDHCEHRHEIFGHGSVKPLCDKLGVRFLGEIPLEAEARRLSDLGQPAVVSLPDSASAAAFRDLAKQVERGLGNKVANWEA